MKKLVGLLIVMSLAASVHAGLDIGFSSNNGGHWSYTASGVGEGTFSFAEAGVDNVPEINTSPVALGDSVFTPAIEVSNLVDVLPGIYTGDITLVASPIEIRKGQGNGNNDPILTGNLGTGTIVIAGTTASLYWDLNSAGDITNILWNNWAGPDSLDFSLTLQGGTDIAAMIRGNQDNEAGGTFSGSMTVPEPATMFILAMGSALLWKNK
jgi:hypothetical protein